MLRDTKSSISPRKFVLLHFSRSLFHGADPRCQTFTSRHGNANERVVVSNLGKQTLWFTLTLFRVFLFLYSSCSDVGSISDFRKTTDFCSCVQN